MALSARRQAEGGRSLNGAAIYRCSKLSEVLLRYPSKADEAQRIALDEAQRIALDEAQRNATGEVSVQRNLERY